MIWYEFRWKWLKTMICISHVFFRRHLKRWRKNKTCHSFLYPFIPIWIHPTCNFWHFEDSELVDLVRHGSVSYWCGNLTEQAVVSTTFQYDLTAWFHVPQRLEFGCPNAEDMSAATACLSALVVYCFWHCPYLILLGPQWDSCAVACTSFI